MKYVINNGGYRRYLEEEVNIGKKEKGITQIGGH